MKNKIISGFVCMLLILSVLFSSMAIAELNHIDTENSLHMFGEELTEPIAITDNDIDNTGFRFVVWDNWMGYNAVIPAYWNETSQEDFNAADDFIFEEDTEVFDVHWIDAISGDNYQQGIKEWKIIFYEDRGDEKAPGNIFAGPFNYSYDQCNFEVLYEEEDAAIYEYFVNLSGYILFPRNTKFWISIWGENTSDPKSYWGGHNIPMKLNYSVIKSGSTGVLDWTEYPVDLCFQLTTVVDYLPPKINIIKPERWIYLGEKKLLPRFLGLTTIIGKITIQVDATDIETGIDRVEFYGGLLGTKLLGVDTTAPYNFTWYRDRIRFIHMQILRVVVYDYAGNTAVKKMIVRKIL